MRKPVTGRMFGMRRIGAILAAALLFSPLAAQAQDSVGSYGADASRIQRGRDPGAKPLRRDKYDEAVGKLFNAGDSNRDGTITLAEFNATVSAGRERAIRDRFATIDSDRDDTLSLAEFAEWQRRLGSTVLVDGPEAGGGALVAEEIRIGFGRGDENELIERVIAPLTATALVEANGDYDAGVSLAELVAWEGQAFEKADDNGDGFVTFDELAFNRPPPAH
jgi:hypothetical protein